ncbi:cobalamin biosynthesis protein [Alteromonas halophila]|uniref:Cobalamin biosynthesis protein CbiB n=1 Tax=Alteromonas halophila TaxID=516698 RepID=A0A918N1F2_9ALTE|nr:cobalamin biosynthesis protein [Alteromonas halophila]GGW97813.1 cobalamin biosynthesis protein CbiB [Alteromonas halophila]
MEALLNHATIQSLGILLFAVLLNALWRWPPASHPLTLMRYLALRMAHKVCPKPSDGPLQHKISGSLGTFMLVAPISVALAILVSMAQYPLFFHAIIMVVVLDFHQVRYQYKQVLRTIGQHKKMLARENVAAMVARDCDTLTDVGIAKAAIESLLLKFYYLYCGVIFWFIAAGPVAALVYRLLLDISWQWYTRIPRYRLFGRPVRALVRLLRFFPALFGAVIMLMVSHAPQAIRSMNDARAKDMTSRLLALFGGGLGIELGGPAYYGKQRLNQVRVGGSRQVRYSDMVYAKRAVYRAMILLVTLVSLGMLVMAALNPQLTVS